MQIQTEPCLHNSWLHRKANTICKYDLMFVHHVLSIKTYVDSFSQSKSPCTWEVEKYSACNQDVLEQVPCA